MEGRFRRLPLSTTASRFRKQQKAKQGSGFSCKFLIEAFFFLFWMLFTGFAGYLVGYSSTPDPTSLDKNTGTVQLTTSTDFKKCSQKFIATFDYI